MPLDDAFARENLAALYDALNPAGADSDFYLRLPQKRCSIVDIGCGTGLLTRLYAMDGHRVTGIEPAEGMLAIARRNDPQGQVNWLAATGADFQSERRFDLAIMSGHVFQVFLDDDAVLAVLRNIRRHLATGGLLVFDSRNPLVRAWEGWTPPLTARRIDVEDIGRVDVHHQLVDVDGELVTFDSVFSFVDTERQEISRSRLRFASRETIAMLLEMAGFADLTWIGDWDGSDFQADSREIIAKARNPG